MDELGRAYSIHRTVQYLFGKVDDTRPQGRSVHVLEDNIEVDREDIESKDMDWIRLIQDRMQ